MKAMHSRNELLLDQLEEIAGIIRKYNLGEKNYFFQSFSMIDKEDLNIAWEYSQKNVKNREIIKDSTNLSPHLEDQAKHKVVSFFKSKKSIFFYLKSEFDYKELKLDDEKIERRFRQILAKEFIKTKIEYYDSKDKKVKSSKINYKKIVRRTSLVVFLSGVIFFSRIRDGLTPVEKLAERIHEKSRYNSNGAICNDGWVSGSQGRGTCSHHGGVDYYFYKGDYKKSYQECLDEAKKRSWID